MSNEGWFSKLKKMWGNGEEGERRVGTFQKLIILAGVGAAIMIFSSFTTVQKEAQGPRISESEPKEQTVLSNKVKTGEFSIADYEEMHESQLKEILEKIVGVGEVSVMVTLDSSEEVVYEKELQVTTRTTKEVDKNNATRDIADSSRDERVVLVRGDQGEYPLVIKKLKPKVRGVLVAANGAENMKIKILISEAVQRVLQVEPHKISILPKKG